MAGTVRQLSEMEFEWRGDREGRAWLVRLRLCDDCVDGEEGPDDPYAYRHESGGGQMSHAQFLEPNHYWAEFPELYAIACEALRRRTA